MKAAQTWTLHFNVWHGLFKATSVWLNHGNMWLQSIVSIELHNIKDSSYELLLQKKVQNSSTCGLPFIDSIPHSEVQGNSGNATEQLERSKTQIQRAIPLRLEYFGILREGLYSSWVFWRSCLLLSSSPAACMLVLKKWRASHLAEDHFPNHHCLISCGFSELPKKGRIKCIFHWCVQKPRVL